MILKYFHILIIILAFTSLILIYYFNSYFNHEQTYVAFFKSIDHYIQIHNKIIQSRESTPKKLVFFFPHWNGYGNKIYGLLSAFTVSVLTESAIFIDWPEAEAFFQPPLNNTFKKYPAHSSLSFEFKNRTLNYRLTTQDKNHFEYKKNLDFLLNETIPFHKTRLLYSDDVKPYFFTICSNPIYYEKILHYNLAKIETIREARMALFSSQNESQVIDKLYAIGFEVAHNLLNKLWTLKSKFKYQIEKFQQDNFKNYFIIGIQLRSDYMKYRDLKLFIRCARYIEKINNATDRAKWFISTDMKNVFPILKKKFGDKVIEGRGKIGHITYDDNTMYRTVFDNEILSKSNEIIITGGSTFGFVASLRQGKMPYFVEGERQNEWNGACNRATFDKGPSYLGEVSTF
ncbi:unnamed protein product [Brachionus calyciflorus]|uniref:Uncharacterized protein n=1 Tax=Brachionus calyciflorus TaxID=104777 RepID=A0A813XWU5_9BILA|nr:unnamed protein product [Brachionus calyciflorus]